jgi:hypothetical protein
MNNEGGLCTTFVFQKTGIGEIMNVDIKSKRYWYHLLAILTVLCLGNYICIYKSSYK